MERECVIMCPFVHIHDETLSRYPCMLAVNHFVPSFRVGDATAFFKDFKRTQSIWSLAGHGPGFLRYGSVNMHTREWKDGILSKTMRDLGQIPDTHPKWIMLDAWPRCDMVRCPDVSQLL